MQCAAPQRGKNAQVSSCRQFRDPVLDGVLDHRLQQHDRDSYGHRLGSEVALDAQTLPKAQRLECQIVFHDLEFPCEWNELLAPGSERISQSARELRDSLLGTGWIVRYQRPDAVECE